MRRYFGTDGIRGRVGEGIVTPDFVLKLGWAAGRVLGNGGGGKILIGKDTRISGYMFESALEAGLVAAGVDIRLLGPMTTPAVAYLTRTFRADAGIVITASHNPYQDNGIKFFSSEGDKLPDALEAAIEAELEQPLRTVDSSALGKVVRVGDAGGRYIEFCKGTIPSSINFRGLKIVVDCANGATYNTAPHVFEELGASVVRLGVEPNGFNINRDVGSTRPEALCEAVLREGADLGIAFDGDGDRVLMVDSRGELVDGDQLLYIIAKSRLAAGAMRGEVVGTLMSNLGLEHALARLGTGFVRTKVGDRYIMEALKQADGILGGEPSGHIICRDRTTTGDGIVSALQVLAALNRLDCSLDGLCAEVERYPQVLINVRLDRRRDLGELPRVREAVAEAERELDGGGRVLLRMSGTEPLVRVMVEGTDEGQVRRVCERLADVVREQIAV
ncbi:MULTISPECIES: phosphoglucosamine mutase [Marichromatium]|uniref:Phosphoglucosamine mutase n=1 Tax=Marichromatium gracile TaxID=1048 RepID=A0A4R4AAA4_MARGR|nr:MULTISPECIES: phosphoglucosamine mutase [Marichromatium]MBO8085474.1 phosphoglucosamine mutase [Marichromatium sp.]MBK1708818.1 phosphoglucosamine mutase [Marichromatium gracile]RNE88967.1 phosphoglucosamine mutase [Marichromatium sp. AB31]RNE93040.1 phosphoglucosamine mutase [Marichromatium sp. AB32]TCW35499.1 phosphoglucosamine mutase [Marichromatium gracile]